MEKKQNYLIYGFIALIFLVVFVMSRFQTAPQNEVNETSTKEALHSQAAESEPAPVIEHEIPAVTPTKSAPVIKSEQIQAVEPESNPAAEAEPVPVVEPEPTPAAEPEPVPTVEPESTPAAEPEPASYEVVPLEDQDCAKCHPYAVNDIKKRGGLHEPVGGSECHLEHPPIRKNAIPSCDMCHDPGESSHYNIKNCISCHYPHYPTDMDFSKVDSSACLTCHPGQGKEMEAQPSEHANLNCNECHMVHREWAECIDCHTPHDEEMTHADCLSCHKPHSPKTVNYTDSIPNNFCVCCHDGVGDALNSSKKAHSEMSCIDCHENEHMAITQCDGCHGADIHGSYMHEQYPACLSCHKNPHALAE